MKKISSLTHAIENGYDLEFGTIFEKAIANFKKIFLIAGVTYIIISIVVLALLFGIMAALFGTTALLEDVTNIENILPTASSSASAIILSIFGIAILSAISSPINAGLLKMAHLAETDKQFSIGTIFDYYKSKHLKDIVVASFLLALVSNGIASMFELISLGFIGQIITYVIAFFTFLTIPVIIFSNVSAMEAIKASIQLVTKQPLILLGLLIVSIIFAMLGIFALCIGIFFTLPIYNSMIYTIYSNIVTLDDKNEIDEIGTSLES